MPISDIISRRPVDRVAAQVTSSGYHYEPLDKKYNQSIWKDGPPDILHPTKNPQPDLTGTRRGFITIHGYLDEKILVGRCVCGNYELRNAKSWRKALTEEREDYGCQDCSHAKYLKRKDHFRRTGRDL